MGWNDHIDRYDATNSTVTCSCGAIYSIYKDDGEPGCRDIESVFCQFCGKKLAQHFGTCDGHLIDAKKVPDGLKSEYDRHRMAVDAYISKNGYSWGTDEYEAVLRTHHEKVAAVLSKLKESEVT